MVIYRWDPVQRTFITVPLERHVPAGERVRLRGLAVSKGEQVREPAAASERLIYMLRGAWRLTIADSTLVVRPSEAVLIPSSFPHLAEAIEDSFALQVVRDHEDDEEDYGWGV